MKEQLIVTDSVLIDALPERVWEVLVTPEYIRQWDDLPVHFGHEPLHHGTVIEWPGFSRLSVITCEPFKTLKLSLYDPSWEAPASHYDIAYNYLLEEDHGKTLLTITVGDFGQLADGKKYYEASKEFANKATLKIKELAEA